MKARDRFGPATPEEKAHSALLRNLEDQLWGCSPKEFLLGRWGQSADADLVIVDSPKPRRLRVYGSRRGGFALRTRERIERLHQWVCLYCGRTDATLELDHVWPLQLGGGDHDDNLATACKACNVSKGKHRLDHWLTIRIDLSHADIVARWRAARGGLPLPGVES